MSDNRTIHILEIPVANITTREFTSSVDRAITSGKNITIFYANAHTLNCTSDDPELKEIFSNATLIYPDGIGIDLAAIMSGHRLQENLTGTDLIPKLLRLANEKRWSLFLLGTESRRLENAVRRLQGDFPGIHLVGSHHGYYSDEDESKVVQSIASLKPDILLVGMGTPRQEKFSACNRKKLNAGAVITVGAFFDYYSGSLKRAPLWIRKIRCEWVYLLVVKPKRSVKRYIVGNPLFMWRVFKSRFRKRGKGK